MLKIRFIRGIINVSSYVQTTLINYLEFKKTVPREFIDKGYELHRPRPGRPESLPKPFQKEDVIKPHYTFLLELAEKRGKPIRPLAKRRKVPLRTGEKSCQKCKAPENYLWNHGFYTRKSTGEKFPKHSCKVCWAEYAPGAKRKKPKHICPYCGFAMNPQNYRKNFTVYFCCQEDCSHLEMHPEGNRYNEREWHFDYDRLETREIKSTKKLETMRISKNILDMEMSLFVECGMGAKETVKILGKIYGEVAMRSPQTVFNHAEAMAAFIEENETALPMPLSNKVCEDETYLKYFGKWGYLFRAFNPVNRAIIAEYFSEHRDTKGAIILNKKVTDHYLSRYRDPEYLLISDQAPIYPAAINYLNDYKKAIIRHETVKGIFDEPGDESEYRSEKQMIERSFESLKSAVKRRRRFGSLKGTKTFCYLHKIFYNHLRPHESLKNNPPIPLYLKSGKRVKTWHELLQYLAEKRR